MKFTGSADAPSPNSQTASAEKGKVDDKNSKDNAKPNWLTDPRFQKTKETQSGGGADSGGLPGKPGWGIPKPEGGWVPPNQVAGGVSSPAPMINGQGTPVNPLPSNPPPGRFAPKTPAASAPAGPTRAVSEADMKEVRTFIDNRSGATGQMPEPREVLDALVVVKSPAADLVRDGSIVLTGSKSRDSLWAYEKAALTQGGLVVGPNGVERLTAAQLASQLMGR